MNKNKIFHILIIFFITLGVAGATIIPNEDASSAWLPSIDRSITLTEDEKISLFEEYLVKFRDELSIPGMSVAIVKDQELLWAKGFGYADVEARLPATPDTVYDIASLTKPLSTTLILQLIDQGLVNLEDPVSKYGIFIKNPGVIRVKHLLGMTSELEPGSVFIYNGGRFAYLQKVIERVTGKPFAELLEANIFGPLGMTNTAPFNLLDQPSYQHIWSLLSKPYSYDRTYFSWLSTGGGLVSSVLDLAKFDIAFDQDKLVSPQTRSLAFTAQALTSGDPPVYGLGRFVQEFQGTKIAWQHGWDCFSHLYVKFLDQDYSLIIMTNSATLAEFTSDVNSVLRYPVILAFYKLFILDMNLGDMVDWNADDEAIATQLDIARASGQGEIARQEIHDRFIAAQVLNRSATAGKAIKTYVQFFTSPELPGGQSLFPFALIDQVGNDAYSIIEFTIQEPTNINIFAIGEYRLGQMVDYGGIEDISSGEMVWIMNRARTSPAGGVEKNRRVNEQVSLPAGTYRLHFRTNAAHSYNRWNDLPPDTLFWGIALSTINADADITVRDVTAFPKDKRLAEQFPPSKPVISNSETVILWTCMGIMLSALVVIPVALWLSRKSVGVSKKIKIWTKTAAWLAWINCLLSPLVIFVVMKFFGLEQVVLEPPIITSETNIQVWILGIVVNICLVITLAQVVFTILAWAGKNHSLAERLYFSLVLVAAIAFYVLLGSWGFVLALW